MINYEATLFDDNRKVRFVFDDLSEFVLHVQGTVPVGSLMLLAMCRYSHGGSNVHNSVRFEVSDIVGDTTVHECTYVILDWLAKHTQYHDINMPEKWACALCTLVGIDHANGTWIEVQYPNGNTNRYDLALG